MSATQAKVLIVGDLEVTAGLEAVLTSLGHAVYGPAGTGEEAVELAGQHCPDLVLMGQDEDGSTANVEAACFIRDRWGIPVVFMLDEVGAVIERDNPDRPFGRISRPVLERDLRLVADMSFFAARAESERRNAEKALLEETIWRRALVDRSRDGIVVLDQTGRVLEANSRFAEMLKYSPEEVLELHVWDWDAQWSRDELIEIIAAVDEAGDHFETRHRCKDGTLIDLEITSSILFRDGRKLIFCVCRDITERKMAETERERLSRQLQLALDAAQLGWWHYNPLTRMSSWDEGYSRIFGVSGQKCSIDEILKLLHPEDFPGVWAAVEASLDPVDPMPYSIEYRINRPDGVMRWVEAHGLAIFEGEGDERRAVNFVGTVQDITDRKKSQEALRKNEERYQVFIEHSPGGVYRLELTRPIDTALSPEQQIDLLFERAGIAECNPALAEMFDLEPDKAPAGIPLAAILGDADDSVVRARLRNFMESGYRLTGEITVEPFEEGPARYFSNGLFGLVENGFLTRLWGTRVDVTKRQLTEDRLRRSEALLNASQHMSGVGGWEWDLGSQRMYWSDETYRIHDIEPGTVEPGSESHIATSLACYRPEDRQAVMDAFSRCVEEGVPYDLEFPFVTASGRHLWVRTTAQAVMEGGHVSRVMGIIMDITYPKRKVEMQAAQLRLIEYAADHSLKDVLRKFLDEAEGLTSSDIGFFHFVEDDQKTISLQTWSTNTLANMCTAEGDSKHYALSKAGVWVDCVREGRTVVHNDYAALPHKKGLPEGHAPLKRELVVPVFRGGKIMAILGVGNKETDYDQDDVDTVSQLAELCWETIVRRRTEGALKTSNARFRTMMESLADPVYICSADHKIEYMNPAMLKRTGYDAVGEYCYQALHGYENRCPWCLWELVADGESYNLEVTSPKDNRTYLISSSPMVNEDNTVSKLTIFRDMTMARRDQAEKEKLQFQFLQAQKMEAVGTLTGGIAHDFNNLLQAINGYAQMLLMSKDEGDPEYEGLATIRKAGDRASELVRQLLLFSRKSEPERRMVDLNRETEHAKILLVRTIPKMIAVDLHLADNLWPIEADPVQMEQVLLNLGSNAADAMPDGGRLVIETENVVLDEEYALNHLETAPGKYVLLTVSDTGQGMDKTTVENIFDPFFTTKSIGQGTGLGLASVYGIVKSHGGHILCYSEVGRGTTFRIYLPASEQDGAAPDLDKPVENVRGGTETILIVDDDELIRGFTSQALSKFGYTVHTATSGEDALENFRETIKVIDLIITDIGMPGMGGHRFLKEVLNIAPRARVLIASGYSANGHVAESLAAGAMGYVGKPYQMAELLAKVRGALDRARPAD